MGTLVKFEPSPKNAEAHTLSATKAPVTVKLLTLNVLKKAEEAHTAPFI